MTVSDLLKLLHMVINERKTDIFLGFLRFFLADAIKTVIFYEIA